MSLLGQEATSRGIGAASAIAPKADINRRRCDVCLVPQADIVDLSR